jgi:hypothetical protein
MLAAATRALGISMTELLVRVQLRLVEYERAAAVSATVGVRSRDALCLAA